MKQISVLISALVTICVFITGCSGQTDRSTAPSSQAQSQNKVTASSDDYASKEKALKVDIDLTALSGTMVYAEVYSMMTSPDNYLGKTIKMRGEFAHYHDEQTGNDYFAIIIADALACCQQGIDFVLSGKHVFPDDYPKDKSQIEITGVFTKSDEDGRLYYYLSSDKIVTVN